MILTDFTDKEIVEYRSKIAYIAYDIEYDNDFDITISPLVKNIDKFNYWLKAKYYTILNYIKEQTIDFKRYKDVLAYFNKNYIKN